MRCRLLCLIAVLVCLCFPGWAEGWQAAGSLEASISVEVCTGNGWQEVPLLLVCAHEHGRLADGLLMFVPLEEFLAAEPERIPAFPVTEDFACRVIATGYAAAFQYERSLYRQTPDGLTELDAAALSPHDLEPGAYLLRLRCRAERGAEYFVGDALAWLIVAAGE